MKKLFLLSILCTTLNAATAQVDTSAVLSTLLANKASFIGKPVSILLQNLPLPVKYYRTPLPFPYLPDTLSIKDIDLSFLSLDENIKNILPNKKCPHIIIYFSSPMQTPKKLFKRGYILDATGDWTINHGIHFGQAIVADFKIYGY
jgi:hypothetical protein